MRAIGKLVRAAAALAVLVALLAGLPWALLRWGDWPITGVPSWEQVSDLPSRVVTDSAIFAVFTVAAWVVWAAFALSVAVELATVRSRHTVNLPMFGPIQRTARTLVASLVMSVSATGPLSGAAVGNAPIHQRSAVVETVDPVTLSADTDLLSDWPVLDEPDTAQPRTQTGPPAPPRESPEVVVAHGDTPWSLAERHLGRGQRWEELWDLNHHRPQPDGGQWTDPELIQPGWRLILPRPSDIETVASRDGYVVQAGDTLSEIADAQLGDASRASEIVDLNQGAPQADGAALSHPDLIRPGWVLQLPTQAPPATVPSDDAGSPEVPPPPPTQPAQPDEPPPQTTTPPEPQPEPAPVTEPTAATAPETTTPQTTAPLEVNDSKAQPGDSDDSVGETAMRWLTPVSVTVALLEACVLWRVARGRRAQIRRREPGSPTPSLDDYYEAEIEQHWRNTADLDANQRVDATLRALTGDLRDASAEVDVAGLEVANGSIEVLLAEPTQYVPEGFEPVGAERWRSAHRRDTAPLELRSLRSLPLLPALVTFGDRGNGAVLLDLERFGVLSIEGDPVRVQAWLRAVTLELACAPWAADITLRVTGSGLDTLTEINNLDVTADVATITTEVSTVAQATKADLGDQSTRVARTQSDDPWAPLVVVVSDQHLPDEITRAAQPGGQGLAVVTAGPVPDAEWRLVIETDGTARLEPWGLWFAVAAGVDAEVAHTAAGLVAAAEAPPVPPSFEEDTYPLAPEAPLAVTDTPVPSGPSPECEELITQVLAPGEIEVAVIGPVEVTGWAAKHPQRSEEIVAYLALHDRHATADKIRAAIWQDAIESTSMHQAMSRCRNALGVSASTGKRLLPVADGHTYRLADTVRSDWERFNILVDAAKQHSSTDRAALLRAALELVRGEPFEGTRAGTYRWADPFMYQMQARLTDIAARLSELALSLNDTELAEWAASQGLTAVPGQESLWRGIGKARKAAGDRQGVANAYAQALASVQAYDPLGELDEPTRSFFEDALR